MVIYTVRLHHCSASFPLISFLQFQDPDYPVTFLIMLVASIISSTLAIRVKKQARQSAQKAYYMELLMNSSQKMQQGRDEQEIIALAAEQVRALLDRPILYSLVVKEKELDFQVCPQSETNKLIGAMTAEEVGL